MNLLVTEEIRIKRFVYNIIVLKEKIIFEMYLTKYMCLTISTVESGKAIKPYMYV